MGNDVRRGPTSALNLNPQFTSYTILLNYSASLSFTAPIGTVDSGNRSWRMSVTTERRRPSANASCFSSSSLVFRLHPTSLPAQIHFYYLVDWKQALVPTGSPVYQESNLPRSCPRSPAVGKLLMMQGSAPPEPLISAHPLAPPPHMITSNLLSSCDWISSWNISHQKHLSFVSGTFLFPLIFPH